MHESGLDAGGAPFEAGLPWWELVIQLAADNLYRPPSDVFDVAALEFPLTPEQERQREILAFVTNLWVNGTDYDTRCPLRLLVEESEEATRETLCNRLASRFEEICFLQRRTQTPELKARLSDLVWSYKRKFRVPVTVAEDAIAAYLAAAAQLQARKKDSGSLCARFARALRLSSSLQNKELCTRAKEAWMLAMQEEVAAGEYTLTLNSARLLCGKSSVIEQELAELLASLVDGISTAALVSEGEEELCELAARFHIKYPERAREFRLKEAWFALGSARLMVARDRQGPLGLMFARRAVLKLKRLEAPKSMQDESLALLRTANSKIGEEHFKEMLTEPVDCTREVRMYLATVSNCSSADSALVKYCTLPIIPDIVSLQNDIASEMNRPASVADLVTSVTWSPDGRSGEEPSLRQF